MSKFLSLACAAMFLGATGSAMAAAKADRSGVYLSLTGGYSTASGDAELSDVRIEDRSFPDASISLDDGWAGNLAVGGYLGLFRIEGEFGYRSNASSGMDAVPGYEASADLDNIMSIMLNAYIDVPVVDRLSVYVGAGIGVAAYQIDIEYSSPEVSGWIDGYLGNVAYQGMLGLTFDITPEIHLSAGTRLFSTLSSELDDDRFEASWKLPVFYSYEASLRFDL